MNFLAVALEATRAAESVILAHHGGAVRLKADGSPVTETDLATEAAIRKTISSYFPDHGFLGEEMGQTPQQDYTWIIDPIDGTKNFIRGIPFFSTEIALMRKDRMILGVSNCPMLHELIFAERGKGAFLGEQRLRAKNVACLKEAFVLGGNLKRYEDPDAILRVALRADRYRAFGHAYNSHLLATGRADAVLEGIIALWDVAALSVILEEAGVKVTQLDGSPIGRNPRTALAAIPAIHKEILGVLSERKIA